MKLVALLTTAFLTLLLTDVAYKLQFRQLFGLLLIVYDMIWLPMQVFEPPEADFFFVMGLVSSLYWSLGQKTVIAFLHSPLVKRRFQQCR